MTSSKGGGGELDAGLLVLRVGLGGVMLCHGIFKILYGIASVVTPIHAAGLPDWLAYGVYVTEVVAPAILILGFIPRAAAVLIAIDMVMAVVLVQKDKLLTIGPGGGWGLEVEGLIFCAAVALAFAGGGRLRIFGG
jgi:putative oxidoreductase